MVNWWIFIKDVGYCFDSDNINMYDNIIMIYYVITYNKC